MAVKMPQGNGVLLLGNLLSVVVRSVSTDSMSGTRCKRPVSGNRMLFCHLLPSRLGTVCHMIPTRAFA
jgi:hypothetical protein